MLAGLDIPSYVMITTGISLADWSAGSRLQTDLLTLDSRSGEPKFDNGPPGATGLRNRQSGRGGESTAFRSLDSSPPPKSASPSVTRHLG